MSPSLIQSTADRLDHYARWLRKQASYVAKKLMDPAERAALLAEAEAVEGLAGMWREELAKRTVKK